MGRIFLSFAGADREIAATVVQRLSSEGVDVWWDQKIDWGTHWSEELEEALTGCTAYLILVGRGGIRRWVKAELLVALFRHFEQELPIFPLLLPGVSPQALPPFLATVQARSLPLEPDTADFAALAARLQEATAGEPTRGVIDTGRCPFPGLEAFQLDDAPFFFGRQVETVRALQRFGPTPEGPYRRWLQVEGASGTGKSSLVRAGLLPAIARGWLGEDDRTNVGRWRMAEPMRPGADPIENLATTLGNLFQTEVHGLDTQLRDPDDRDARALRLLLREARHVPNGHGLVLVVDQFEELFTLTHDDAIRRRFDALLAAALTDLDGPLHLITTIRNDFLHRLPELPRLQALLDDDAMGRYLLPPMTRAGLRDVVMSPARLAGLEWSDANLPREIIDEATQEPGVLPLVGNLLRLLWEERSPANQLTRQAYNDLGGLGGALALRADLLLNDLGKDGRARARCLLLALVEPVSDGQSARRTVTKATVLRAAGGGYQAEWVLGRLSGGRDERTPEHAKAMPRLVTFTEQRASETHAPPDAPEAPPSTDMLVDLAHEALLRDDRNGKPYWPTLRTWVEDERDQLQSRQLVENLATQWFEGNGDLASGRQLRAFLPLLQSCVALSDTAESFLKRSVLKARQRMAATAAASLVVIGLVGGFGYWINSEEMGPVMGFYVLAGKAGWIVKKPPMVEIRPGEGPFAIGRYEVTFEEYELFARLTGRSVTSAEGWGKGSRPVINVSWDDARDYAAWLAEATGKAYRLPSEAEWEYAARGETATDYWWGDEVNADGKVWANCDGCGSEWGNKQTAPVGSFAPNPFGLHDTAGNVWEWVADCWHDNYRGAPADGSVWEEDGGGDCGRRVIRGGSWFDKPVDVRSANRGWSSTVNRVSNIGFRLAQDLD